jgi:LysM repeat protein
MSLYLVVLLVSIALAVSLAFAAPGAPTPTPASTSRSQLPATTPGLTRDEGVFLVTAADDGSRAVYFIAANSRHSILSSTFQLEQQINPLWPVRSASRDEVLAFPEGAPIGSGRTGLLKVDASAPVEAAPEAVADTPSPLVAGMPQPVAEAPQPIAEMPQPVAEAPQPVAEVPQPVVEAPQPVAEAPQPVAEAPSPVASLSPINLPPAVSQSPIDLSPASAEPSVYVLKPGDNLTHISVRYGTTIEAILAANGIATPNRIYIGQSLVIPTSAPTPDVVESPTAPAPIAMDVQEPTADSPAGDEVATTYTVQRGDSAIAIARRLGVDVDELLAVNGVANRNRVYAGQVLSIPGA